MTLTNTRVHKRKDVIMIHIDVPKEFGRAHLNGYKI